VAVSRFGLEVAGDLFDVGVAMREQAFRRQMPAATDAQIMALVQAWLLERPGAPDGDCVGRRVERAGLT
jgi:Rv0078B-related antitoxin